MEFGTKRMTMAENSFCVRWLPCIGASMYPRVPSRFAWRTFSMGYFSKARRATHAAGVAAATTIALAMPSCHHPDHDPKAMRTKRAESRKPPTTPEITTANANRLRSAKGVKMKPSTDSLTANATPDAMANAGDAIHHEATVPIAMPVHAHFFPIVI